MGKRDVRNALMKLEKNQLIDLISDLYDKNKTVKEFLDFYANPNEADMLKAYKIKVHDAFFPKRGFTCKLAVGKKALSDFKKHAVSPTSIIDLLLHYVENGVAYTAGYGDIGISFYSSVESVFADAMKLVEKHGQHELFKPRAADVLKKTRKMGWGFYDGLFMAYHETYGDVE